MSTTPTTVTTEPAPSRENPMNTASIDRRRDNLLRLQDVKSRTGLSRTTIYRRIAAGRFPASLPISTGLVAWYESDIDSWIANPMGWGAAA